MVGPVDARLVVLNCSSVSMGFKREGVQAEVFGFAYFASEIGLSRREEGSRKW
jgi:hypothetical protein